MCGVTDDERLIDLMARRAYTAYSASVDFTSVRGEQLPRWEDTPDRVQAGWVQAACAVVQEWSAHLADVLRAAEDEVLP